MKFNDIVEDILNFVSKEDKEYLISFKESELIKLHSSFGRNIRNKYNLWHKELDDEKYKGQHPDDISMEIIHKVWKELKNDR
jgi:hypothetical protein